jgi:hypothetical protein
MKPYIFISYSSSDHSTAERISRRLEAAAIEHFLDKKKINPGDNFQEKISSHLRRATHLILIVSPGSRKSEWVIFEVGQATALGCRVIPYLTHPDLSPPPFLESLHHTRSIDEIIRFINAEAAEANLRTALLVTDTSHESKVVLRASKRLEPFLRVAPPDWYTGNIAVDGAFEVYSFGDHQNRYGGIGEHKVTVKLLNEEWSTLARHIDAVKLSVLGRALHQWIGARRRKPNRIRYLLQPPKQPVLDNDELILHIGNSDYFTMRAIAEASRASHGRTDNTPLAKVFKSWWIDQGHKFDHTVVPYHVSALGVLLLTDPRTNVRYLVLTLPRADRGALVPGWNASYGEQMWAPSSTSATSPWWSAYVKGLDIEEPVERDGDQSLWATVRRGLREELGVLKEDLVDEPALIMACLEQDIYFIGFVFVVCASLSISEFQKRRESSTDREIGAVALYPIDGPAPNGGRYEPAEQLSRLLASDEFDGGPYLIPRTSGELIRGWHISSRLRIYAAGRHILGDRFMEFAQPVPVETDV